MEQLNQEADRLKAAFAQWRVDETEVPANVFQPFQQNSSKLEVPYKEDITKVIQLIDSGIDMSNSLYDTLEIDEDELNERFAIGCAVPSLIESDGESVDVMGIRRWNDNCNYEALSRLGSNHGTPSSTNVASPKLRRRLTTTIDPSPALIPHLQQLSRTNNRPLSNTEDINWEDGAMEGEALADVGADSDAITTTPKRPAVSASLLQRLQELKAMNNVRSPVAAGPTFRLPMPSRPAMLSTSQMLSNIPDADNTGHLSFLSLGDTSLIFSGSEMTPLSDVECPFEHRMTFGGIKIPNMGFNCNETFTMEDQLINLESTFTKEEDLENRDENMNNELFNGFPTKLFDATFHKDQLDNFDQTVILNAEINDTFTKVTENTFTFDNKVEKTEIKLSTTFNCSSMETCAVKKEGTFTQMIEEPDMDVEVEAEPEVKLSQPEVNKMQYSTATYSRPNKTGNLSMLRTPRDEPNRSKSPAGNLSLLRSSREDVNGSRSPANNLSLLRSSREDVNGSRSPAKNLSLLRSSREDLKSPASKLCMLRSSRDDLNRSAGNLSLIRSSREDLTRPRSPSNVPVMRSSREDLTRPRSPAGNHSLIRASRESLNRSSSPGSEGRSTPAENGTYTRNSPVTIPSEDESADPASARISTPVLSGIRRSMGSEEWNLTPIVPNSVRKPTEVISAPNIVKLKQPLKPVRPTENYKRPIKKTENGTSGVLGRAPLKPLAKANATTTTGLPTRIPATRLSSIPRPASARPSAVTKSSRS